jgi:hypothetical protein
VFENKLVDKIALFDYGIVIVVRFRRFALAPEVNQDHLMIHRKRRNHVTPAKGAAAKAMQKQHWITAAIRFAVETGLAGAGV